MLITETSPALPDTSNLLLALAQSARNEDKTAIACLYVADRFLRDTLSKQNNGSSLLSTQIETCLAHLSVLENLDNLTEKMHNLKLGYDQMRPLLEELKNNLTTVEHGQ